MQRTIPELQFAISTMMVPGVLVGHRVITVGDEFALRPEEYRAFAKSVAKVQRASGAARIVARHLLKQVSEADHAIVKSASGAPNWPQGIVGSLAHDVEVAVAAIALQRQFLGVGIDVEPASAIDSDLLGLIASATERATIRDDLLLARVLFTIKEAVYKAAYPLDGTFLNHHDVEVMLADSTVRIRNGRVVEFRYCVASHIVALAFIPNAIKTA